MLRNSIFVCEMSEGNLRLLLGVLGGTCLGVAIGYVSFSGNEPVEPEIIVEHHVKKRVVTDTVYIPSKKQKKLSYTEPKDVEEFVIDSLEVEADTTVLQEDTNNVSDDLIVSETMSSQIKVKLRKELSNDSLDVEEMFNVKSEHFANELNVQFWTSPLQLTGYELSRNTLKLFGFDPRQAVFLQTGDGKELRLKIDTLDFQLRKTEKFISLDL